MNRHCPTGDPTLGDYADAARRGWTAACDLARRFGVPVQAAREVMHLGAGVGAWTLDGWRIEKVSTGW